MTADTAPGAGDADRDALANPDPATITVWSDLSCPWATLALHTLHRAAIRRGSDLLIDHRAFPLELFNRSPTPKELVDTEVTVIAGRIPDLGWQLWHGPAHAYPATLLPAMEAVQAAKDPAVGGLRASDELDQALRHAFFVDSQCISIHPAILDIAERCATVDHHELARRLAHGHGRPEVYRQWQTAQGPAVQGSPHIFTAGGFAVHNPERHLPLDRPPTARLPAGTTLPTGARALRPTWPQALLDVVDRRIPDE